MSNTSTSGKRNNNWFRRKPLWVVSQQEAEQATRRHLTLFDLVSVGIGGTIGSGIFVLAGYIAHHYAGPATVLSFAASGLAACCSGICYAELAGRLPASGSTYVYTYVAMGEVAAVVAAAC
jgi:amino acid transporter